MKLQNEQMELATKSFSANVTIIEDKVGKATAALSVVKKVDSDEDDEKARVLLSRVRSTFDVIQGLRKEITDPLDSIKKSLMEFEKKIDTKKGSNSGYQRVKLLRDQYANEKAFLAKKEADKIEREKNIKLEIADVKLKLKSSIELGVFDLIKEGEISLTKFVNEMTLENFEEQKGKLNYTPKLKKEAFEKMLVVEYNQELIKESEYLVIAKEFSTYDKIDEVYSDESTKKLNHFKNEVIPQRFLELEELSKLDESEKIKEQEIADAKAKENLEAIENKYEAEKLAAIEDAEDKAAEAKIDAEFEAQVSAQQIEEQSGIRKNISYKIDQSIVSNPGAIVETITKVITHVMVNANFSGIVKRDTGGFPKTDDKGNVILVDGIEFWLKQLVKLKIDVDEAKIPNLVKTEEITTIAKS